MSNTVRRSTIRRPVPPRKAAAPAQRQRRSAPRRAGWGLRIRRFDRFRRDETSSAIFNTILAGIALVIVLAILAALKPGWDDHRTRSLAKSGRTAQSVELLREMESKHYSPEKLEATRSYMVTAFLKNGEYAQAQSLLSEIEDEALRGEMEKEYNYYRAVGDYDAGDYVSAAQGFYTMMDERDCAARYAESRCALAFETYLEGKEASAQSLLVDTPDSENHLSSAALKVTGSQENADALLSLELFDPELIVSMRESLSKLVQARHEQPKERLALGRGYTVGLKSDGTVIAAGDNSKGQCEVSTWSGIVQLAAGTEHTLGLRSDGTVVATGDNQWGQCNVSEWTGIVSIAAASYATIGLKSDGSVVTCGVCAESIKSWHDVAFLAGGSYSIGCIDRNGGMLCSHKGGQLEMGVKLCDLSVWGQTAVGVQEDGTLVTNANGLPEWTDMMSATAYDGGVLGINSAGRALCYTYRTGVAETLPIIDVVLEVEGSGTHYAALTANGRVYAFGDNSFGQCDVQNWIL